MARPPRGPKQVETLTHEEASRRNIPTAELQSTAEYLEELNPAEPARYARARPLAPGTQRERDEDLDPQIIWNGARIRLTHAQVQQLHDTGEVELGDAQLVWRGKDTQDWSDLIVQTPPLYIQEKIHPKAIIDDLKRRSQGGKPAADTMDVPASRSAIAGINLRMARLRKAPGRHRRSISPGFHCAAAASGAVRRDANPADTSGAGRP